MLLSTKSGGVQVMDFLGSAAFSKAVQALDIKTGMLVCLKIVKVLARRPILLACLHYITPAFALQL